MAKTPLDWLAIVIATGFGSGFAPVASGTFGTAVAVPIYFGLSLLQPAWWVELLFLLVVTGVGMLCAERVGKRFFHAADAGEIVVDEIAGYLLTVLFVPFSWKVALLGFGFFRLFDITKPWPASYFDAKVHNGFGVTMDDLCAGVYARLALALTLHFWP